MDHRMGQVVNQRGGIDDLALLGGSTGGRRRRHCRRRIFQSKGVDGMWGVKETVVPLLSFSGRRRIILGWITNN